MKKVLLVSVMAVALFLSGCNDSTEKVNCYECGDLVDRWIECGPDDAICARCFQENGYQICRGCGYAYNPKYTDSYDGYCAGCAELQTWTCSLCEERYALDRLADLGDGYYLCADCTLYYLECLEKEYMEPGTGPIAWTKENSPIYSRDDYIRGNLG